MPACSRRFDSLFLAAVSFSRHPFLFALSSTFLRFPSVLICLFRLSSACRSPICKIRADLPRKFVGFKVHLLKSSQKFSRFLCSRMSHFACSRANQKWIFIYHSQSRKLNENGGAVFIDVPCTLPNKEDSCTKSGD